MIDLTFSEHIFLYSLVLTNISCYLMSFFHTIFSFQSSTSGPQAVLEAYGGIMAKLPKFLKNKELESYTFTKTKINTDFEPDQTLFTLSNAKDKRVARMVRDVKVTEVELVKEYSCLQGLIALDKTNAAKLDQFHAALTEVDKDFPPMYT